MWFNHPCGKEITPVHTANLRLAVKCQSRAATLNRRLEEVVVTPTPHGDKSNTFFIALQD